MSPPPPSPTPTPPTPPSEQAAALLERVVARLPGGGELRAGQRDMVGAVDRAIGSGRHVVVQAGTGTGKSIGYLVAVAVSGRTTVIATATKALQDQLAGKDLPLLVETLGLLGAGGPSFAVLKGRSNYFCRQRAAELVIGQRAATAAGTQLSIDGLDGSSRPLPTAVLAEVARLATWAASSPTGDRADLDTEPSALAWSLVSVSAGECPGKAKCPMGQTCFAEVARERAAEADVIVVNTHLYGQHVRSGGFILPAHDVVVIDEAHELEDIVADSLGTDIGSSRLTFLAGRLRAVVADADTAVDLASVARSLDEALAPWAGRRLTQGPGAVAEVRRALAAALGRVQHGIELLRSVGARAAANADLGARATRAMLAASQLADDLERAISLGVVRRGPAGAPPGRVGTETADDTDSGPGAVGGDELVAWVEAATGGRGPVLRIAPVEVASSLASTVWDRVTAVLTSATIPIGLGERLGLPADRTDELRVSSPFDYPAQSLLYCAVHLPDPRAAGFEAASHDELRALIGAAGGRTLALFTSWRAMRAAADALRDLDLTMLVQGELPKPALLSRFSSEETSCLFATMGFWQGIDVPGRSLTLVTIDKLPFGRPDEPLLVARRERAGPRAFELIDLPRAAMMLAQGTGRLIRSSTDRGVVAVLDRRLNFAGYRRTLIEALPPMRRTRDRAEVERFLADIVAGAAPVD